ncbi:multicopper oxidase CueO [Rodentibacter genomosp. 2]|uniref:Multicopper oxidase n=1 Tax=Rodentibacter genomosp. 2 TaxID=1908266 RepID=A0A1V3JPF7_9PAST|nr:multicopper oxidase CueO [Rodentibacter genomosp. 2]OOF58279.1 multicopper oxidase [Rodentibacter genomosp. 2]
MQRRNFLKHCALFIATAGIPMKWGWAKEKQTTLPIPRLLETDKGEIRLTVEQGTSQFGQYHTTTWGYNGSLLGPAIRAKSGQEVRVNIQNNLPEETTLHWHGLEIPGDVDGGPQAIIKPEQQHQVNFIINQPASTCWFHPHPHRKTGYQVAMGLAGLFLIEDELSSTLPLPKQWGVDDIPVVLQDKRFDEKGQIDYKIDILTASLGWFGDTMLTNGAQYPKHIAPKGWVRLRLLNGCNARSLRLATSDERPMYVIASDGGFLSEPIKVNELEMIMGERFEVLIDLSDGKAVDLVSLPVNQMGMGLPPFNQKLPLLSLETTLQKGQGSLPTKLANLPKVKIPKDIVVRRFQLSMDPELDHQGMQLVMQKYGHQGMNMMHHMNMPEHTMPISHDAHMQHMKHSGDMSVPKKETLDIWTANRINGQSFHHHPVFSTKQGQYEKWVISGEGDMMLHPFHVHGTQFRILSENGKPPAAHRQGWKDTVSVNGAVSEILVKFDYLAGNQTPYMAHCHLLEHEDTGMMLAFTVEK